MLRYKTIGIICLLFLVAKGWLYADFSKYASNPYAFSIQESPFYGTFFAADLNNDTLPDFTYRSETTLYVYDHWGNALWQYALDYPCPEINNYGVKHGAADVDGDGKTEIVALDNAAHIYIFNGATGSVERILNLPSLGTNQLACHIAIVNLRGVGDRDVIIQTCDVAEEYHTNENTLGYYFNRTLIAMNLENANVLWRVEQDADYTNGFYEGYWGPAHSPFFAADVDGDGLDEVVGGNLVESNGTVIDLGYPQSWLDVDAPASYADHIDGISVGDVRPDLTGIEWVITDEDNTGKTHYNTSLMTTGGIVWSNQLSEPSVLPAAKEPQHTAIGNFDPNSTFVETWVRSRLGGLGSAYYSPYDSQWPWLYDYQGSLYSRVTTYRMVERLPKNFNTDATDGNKLGIEITWTIDWDGSKKEYVVGKARFVDGHVGILDVWKTAYQYKVDTVWTTMKRRSSIQTQMLYVADLAGDGREEMTVYDASDGKIRIYANSKTNSNQPKPSKWDDPLYRRLKQNWNFYSPGSYTYSNFPTISNIQVANITASGATISWTTDETATSQIGFGTTDRLGSLSNEDAGLVTQHTLAIDSLAKNTAYKFQIRSKNQYGNLGISVIQSLTLLTLSAVEMEAISSSASQTQLTWDVMANITLFNVYRGAAVDFVPDETNRIAHKIADENTGVSGVQWTDTENQKTTRFYKVTAASGIYEGDPSETYGVYVYPVVTGAGTDFNLIGLPLETSGLSKASDLMALIPGCNSVARWDAAQQGFQQYISAISSTNFTIQNGQAYYVNATLDTSLSVSGKVYSPTYSLIATASSSFNQILLPLDKTDIETASQLAADIPNCNSVACWDATAQGYTLQYDPAAPATDFNVTSGQPYLVNVTANTTWPSGSGKAAIAALGTNETPEYSHAPHLVWGTLDLADGMSAFRAYRAENPTEILTETSPGCGIMEDRWQVQCGNFGGGWRPGEKLKVEFIGTENTLSVAEITLSSNPSDRFYPNWISSETLLPTKSALMHNYPNPFNPTTTIPYALALEGRVLIQVFNARGQLVKTLVDRQESAGFKETIWKGEDASGNQVSGGLYLVSMSTGNIREIRKILLLK